MCRVELLRRARRPTNSPHPPLRVCYFRVLCVAFQWRFWVRVIVLQSSGLGVTGFELATKGSMGSVGEGEVFLGVSIC